MSKGFSTATTVKNRVSSSGNDKHGNEEESYEFIGLHCTFNLAMVMCAVCTDH